MRIAFHGFWRGFTFGEFCAMHPYLKLKYELVACRRRPDVHFVSVFSPAGRVRRDGSAIPVPGDGRTTVFYTGERVAADADRFDWSISFDENRGDRNLHLPGWVRHLNRLGVTPYALLRGTDAPAPAQDRRPCAYLFRNRVPLREAFFDSLARHMEIVSPGRSRANHPPIGATWAEKLAFLRRFRFNVAFENERFPGYLTEKIADAFLAGCVPIYCGDPLVERTFSGQAFVHVRGEADFERAIERILTLEGDAARLEAMRGEAPLVDNRLPHHATHECGMAFFERIFDEAVRR